MADESEPPGSLGEDARMLDQMIRQTIGVGDTQPGDEKLHRQLMQVAQKYRQNELVSDEVGIELVHAASVAFLGVPAELQPRWREISSVVAQTLLNDPSARPQLDLLWQNLRAEANGTGIAVG